MISKKKFVELMNKFNSLREIESNVDSSLKKLCPDFGGFSLSKHNELIVNMFEQMMNDKEGWISYWLYEIDCGNKYLGDATVDGKKVPIKTVEDLYNIIVKRS